MIEQMETKNTIGAQMAPVISDSDLSLAQNAKEEAIVRIYHSIILICEKIRRKRFKELDFQEVKSDCYMWLLDILSKYRRRDTGGFINYFKKYVYHKMRDKAIHQRKLGTLHDRTSLSHDLNGLLKELEILSPVENTIFRRYFIDGFKLKEIAGINHCSIYKIWEIKEAAKRKLGLQNNLDTLERAVRSRKTWRENHSDYYRDYRKKQLSP